MANTYEVTEKQLKVIEGLRSLGKVTVKDVSVAYGKAPEKVAGSVSEIVFDFSDLDAEKFFSSFVSTMLLVKYRQKYWIPSIKDALEEGKRVHEAGETAKLLSALPTEASIGTLCTKEGRKGGSKLREKVFTLSAAIMTQAIETTIALAYVEAPVDLIRATVEKSDVSWSVILRYLKEDKRTSYQEAYTYIMDRLEGEMKEDGDDDGNGENGTE